MKCPVCSGKLDFNLKIRSAACHTCGWKRDFLMNCAGYTKVREKSSLTPPKKASLNL